MKTKNENNGTVESVGLDYQLLELVANEFRIAAPRLTADEHSKHALKILKEKASKEHQAKRQELIKAGYSLTIDEVSKKINKSGIHNTLRYLLAEESLYVTILHEVILKEGITDTQGIYSRVSALTNRMKVEFFSEAIRHVMDDANIDKQAVSIKALLTEVIKKNPSINATQSPILKLINELDDLGLIPDLIEAFFSRPKPEVDPSKATDEVKKSMANYLMSVGLVVTQDAINNPSQKFDEALFYAYAQAIKKSSNGEDPISNLYSNTYDSEWDYSVDTFETIEEQGVDKENIYAAAALFYIKTLGDDLGIFRVADAIILAWTQGRLDIPQGETSSKLYRYYKLREERTTMEERAMFYKQVLNIGDAEMLDNMVANEEFSQLWEVLMEEVVRYIEKYESADSPDYISKTPVYQSLKDIQYNLTTRTSGMVKAMTREMYAHLQSAIEILREQTVVDQLGYGYQKSMWKVIERVSQSEFDSIPNVSALRRAAIEGNKLLRWIADFDEGSVTEENFVEFLHIAENFIISQSQLIDNDDNDGYNEREIDNMLDEDNDDWDF
ncbi:hypothetical protein [Roseivirga thermotolerans]|uniref:Uncharacterized protein n=1 Tax=Roseivirga thermotolerans TaxID=1758176 RepID=A0ABQ3I720_9BACT|nr:hypothetical protein [Roseivirga thermotolerans]GHE60969.1 hypothetical protein GCM10011340_14840 [Roseivirga thermotolerans]